MANTNVPTAPGWPGRASTPTPRRSPVPRRRRLLVLALMLVVIAVAILANYGPLQTYRGAQERLEQAGFALERFWHYFSPSALRVLEWGHYFGLPSWIVHQFTGRWILVKSNWTLWLTEKMVRRYALFFTV